MTGPPTDAYSLLVVPVRLYEEKTGKTAPPGSVGIAMHRFPGRSDWIPEFLTAESGPVVAEQPDAERQARIIRDHEETGAAAPHLPIDDRKLPKP